MNRTALAFFSLLLAGYVAGDELTIRHDPFRVPDVLSQKGSAVVGGVAVAAQLPVVRGVIISEAFKAANINGRVVSEGEEVASYRVQKIEDGLVIFSKNDREYRVPVYVNETMEERQ